MDKVQVGLPATIWEELVSLGQEEAAFPDELVERAVRDHLDDRGKQHAARRALDQSFGIWKDREDLEGVSAALLDQWRREWDERGHRIDST